MQLPDNLINYPSLSKSLVASDGALIARQFMTQHVCALIAQAAPQVQTSFPARQDASGKFPPLPYLALPQVFRQFTHEICSSPAVRSIEKASGLMDLLPDPWLRESSILPSRKYSPGWHTDNILPNGLTKAAGIITRIDTPSSNSDNLTTGDAVIFTRPGAEIPIIEAIHDAGAILMIWFYYWFSDQHGHQRLELR